jgi:hypothetical protein
MRRGVIARIFAVLSVVLSACGGGTDAQTMHTIGGTVKYLNGNGLVLRLAGGDDLHISKGGRFLFSTKLANGTQYSVTVEVNPSRPSNSQSCSIINPTGTVAGSDVTNIDVVCTPWTKHIGSDKQDSAGSIAMDIDGNIYVTGIIDSDPYADPGNLFIAKYDIDGNMRWRNNITSSGAYLTGSASYPFVAVDSHGNVYVSGTTDSTVDTNVSNQGYLDIFLVKYDSDGGKLWSRQHGTSTLDYVYAIGVDHTGSIYLAGETGSLPYCHCNKDLYLDHGQPHGLIVKYDSNGNELWANRIEASDWFQIADIETNASDNLHVASSTGAIAKYNSNGAFIEMIVAGPPAIAGYRFSRMKVDADGNIYAIGNTCFVPLFGWNQPCSGILTKYNSRGIEVQTWTTGLAQAYFANLSLDGRGNVFVVGGFDAEGPSTTTEALVAKFNSSGTSWIRRVSPGDYMDVFGNDIVAGSGDNIYVVGTTYGGLDGNLMGGDFSPVQGKPQKSDGFVIKYDAEGMRQ